MTAKEDKAANPGDRLQGEREGWSARDRALREQSAGSRDLSVDIPV